MIFWSTILRKPLKDVALQRNLRNKENRQFHPERPSDRLRRRFIGWLCPSSDGLVPYILSVPDSIIKYTKWRNIWGQKNIYSSAAEPAGRITFVEWVKYERAAFSPMVVVGDDSLKCCIFGRWICATISILKELQIYLRTYLYAEGGKIPKSIPIFFNHSIPY